MLYSGWRSFCSVNRCQDDSEPLRISDIRSGSAPEALALAKDTCTNPAVLDAFALVIACDGQRVAYPGISGHEPDLATARKAASMINQAMDRLRAVAGEKAAHRS